MSAVEWNKKEDLVAEQALKHLKTYTPLLESLSQGARAQLSLVQKVSVHVGNHFSPCIFNKYDFRHIGNNF